MFLATHGWWPWLLLYAIIIGVIGAGLVYLLRRRRANKVMWSRPPKCLPPLHCPMLPRRLAPLATRTRNRTATSRSAAVIS